MPVRILAIDEMALPQTEYTTRVDRYIIRYIILIPERNCHFVVQEAQKV
jgi:hypothetical protein